MLNFFLFEEKMYFALSINCACCLSCESTYCKFCDVVSDKTVHEKVHVLFSLNLL